MNTTSEGQPPADEPQVLEGVSKIYDVDVLCGRGGAALRHPGNQTYRRLVNLNKGLYITCLKTEKLKISRSIVAAIREQKGRFLEKESKSNTWYDIGDKKAVEKTSQALREGQPKLRQKIVEMGGGAMGAASLMERQYGVQASVYPEQVGLNTASNLESMLPPATATQQEVAALAASQMQRQQALRDSQGPQHMPSSAQQLPHQQQRQHPHQQLPHQQQQHQHQHRSSSGSMPPPDISVSDDLQADMLQRLSLRDLNNGGGVGPGGEDEFPVPQHVAREMRPSLTLRGSTVGNQLGFAESNMSLMSDFSAFGSNRDGMMQQNESLQTMEGAYQRGVDRSAINQSQQSITSAGDLMYGRAHEMRQTMPSSLGVGRGGDGTFSNHSNAMSQSLPTKPYHPQHHSNIMADRRSMFARMKYTRPPSVHGKMTTGSSHHGQSGSLRDGMSNHSMGDGMPDIHMVESQLSLISNMTDHNSSKHNPHNASSSAVPASAGGATAPQPDRKSSKSSGGAMDEKMEGSSIHSSGMDLGSRHSIMSGLSRISDTSLDASIFSDLSKKIGNVSTRSIAMSEISGFEIPHERSVVESNEAGEEGYSQEAVERVSAADFP